jgi:CRP/FNR family transcriptional regulator, cyclic AMP receptor protein
MEYGQPLPVRAARVQPPRVAGERQLDTDHDMDCSQHRQPPAVSSDTREMNTARPSRTATVAELATVPMLAHVAGARLRELAAAHPLIHLTPGSVLLHQGTPATRLLIMLNGQATAVTDHPDGTRSRYPLITGPCVIDKAATLAAGNYPATWVATTPGQALALSGHAFRALLREQHKMREHVLRYLAIQVSQTRAALTARIASSALTRVARWLITASGSGARPIVRLPAGQQGIAEELGLSRITVNRALQQLAQAGAVRPRPRAIIVLNPAQLAFLTETSSPY